LNTFRMFGLLEGDRVEASSTGAVSMDEILRSGVRGAPDIDAIAVRHNHGIAILLWNYHDDDVAAPDAAVRLLVSGGPAGGQETLIEHFRIDGLHSNAYAAWKRLGEPSHLSSDQLELVQATGQLQPLDSPHWVQATNGQIKLEFNLPRQALSLIRIAW
jgi:xylan 1,4-beta-xylosidase